MAIGIANWGPLVIATDVDEAIIATFQEWLPTYVQQLVEERERDIAQPAYIGNALDADEFLDQQLPAVIIQTAEASQTIGGANMLYQAVWRVQVHAIVRGRAPAESRKTAALYEGAIRRCFLNKCRGSDGPLNDPAWKGMRIMEVPDSTGRGRYLAAGLGTYNVATDAAVQSFGGPDVPNADIYLPSAKVTEVDISVLAESEG